MIVCPRERGQGAQEKPECSPGQEDDGQARKVHGVKGTVVSDRRSRHFGSTPGSGDDFLSILWVGVGAALPEWNLGARPERRSRQTSSRGAAFPLSDCRHSTDFPHLSAKINPIDQIVKPSRVSRWKSL